VVGIFEVIVLHTPFSVVVVISVSVLTNVTVSVEAWAVVVV
jgi:hypothetical protein